MVEQETDVSKFKEILRERILAQIRYGISLVNSDEGHLTDSDRYARSNRAEGMILLVGNLELISREDVMKLLGENLKASLELSDEILRRYTSDKPT